MRGSRQSGNLRNHERTGEERGVGNQCPLFACYHGRYELVTRDEEYPMTDGSRMVLPRVNYLRCVECGEEILTSESDRYIQGFGPPQVEVIGTRLE